MFGWLGNRSKNETKLDGPLIEVRDIKKIYKTEAGDFQALKGIDLTIHSGEFVGIVGKSGSGKSTLVNMITGIDRPSSGEVVVNGTAIHHLDEGHMAQWRGVSMGVVFQFFQLLPTLTVIENVMLPMDFCHMYSTRERRDRAMELLRLMDVEAQAHKLPTMISGGQQQRVAIARALANDPPIVVADEPTGNLDSRTAGQVFELFQSLVDAGKTFLMVTHDDELARRLSRVIMIADGELVDERLLKAFPALSNDLLLDAHHHTQTETFQPGQIIARPDSGPRKFYIVSSGTVRLENGTGSSVLLSKGQVFGALPPDVDGQQSVTASATAGAPVEVLTLDPALVAGYLSQSPATHDALRESFARRRSADNGPAADADAVAPVAAPIIEPKSPAPITPPEPVVTVPALVDSSEDMILRPDQG